MLLTDRHLPSGFEMSGAGAGRGCQTCRLCISGSSPDSVPGEAMEQGAEVLAGPLAVLSLVLPGLAFTPQLGVIKPRVPLTH